jgi:hypothetical protein
MRKTILAIAAVSALATPAFAESVTVYGRDYYNPAAPAEVATGAVAGTAVGVGISEGWFGTTVAGSALPATAAGAATVGGVVGVGAVAAIDGVVQPCRGVQAFFGMNKDACVDGHYVGHGRVATAGQRYYR